MDEYGRWRLFLVSQEPGRTGDLEIYKTDYRIGRDETAVDGVIVINPLISRVHCRIDFDEGGCFITDLQSRNGTERNGEKLTPGLPYPLFNGDIISLAGTKYAVLLIYEVA